MIPGGNLLNAALTLIASQSVTYYQNTARTLNPQGQYVTAFAAPITVPRGSVQAVPLDRYEDLGLDRKKSYVTWFASVNVVGVERDRSGDEFEYAGRRYQVVGESPWFTQDGWVSVIGVDIKGAI